MFRIIVLAAFLGAASVDGLKCMAGFNASFAGIPFSQWYENGCASESKCFTQEIGLALKNDLNVIVRYGGCVSNAYADLITCHSLFGPDSTLDPAKILDWIPDLDEHFKVLIAQFTTDVLQKLKKLFSAGGGTREFISGMITFYENLGYRVDKLRQLEGPLTTLFETFFTNTTGQEKGDQINAAVDGLLTAIGNLDTGNEKITTSLYKFLGTLTNVTAIQGSKYAPLIEKLPGLYKSTLPVAWEPEKWFDVIFEVLGDINYKDPKQSVTDALQTIKDAAKIPEKYDKYVDPFFDSLPELVSQLAAGNSSYTSYWSVQMLKAFSEVTESTTALSTSIMSFLGKLGIQTLPGDIETLITYLPGYFFQFFPSEKHTKIDEVYNKMATGFNSFNFSNPNATSPTTEMSKFIIFMANKISPFPPDAVARLFVINFSHMFTQLMSDYTAEVDTFFTTLSTGFEQFPQYNAGQIVTDLVQKLGGTVPNEVAPLLNNVQDIINGFSPFNTSVLYSATIKMIGAYEEAFPDSDFPPIARRYIELIKKYTQGPQLTPELNKQYMKESYHLSIDLQFALVKLMKTETDSVISALVKAFPAYGTYIKMMNALKPEDVKSLMDNIVNWLVNGITNPSTLSTESFVDAVKPSVKLLTSQLGDITKEIRHIFAPNSCKHNSCEEDDCNTHEAIESQTALIKATPSTTTTTTTSGSVKNKFSVVIGAVIMVLAAMNS